MQRSLLRTLSLSNSYEIDWSKSVVTQFVRWRKRRWAPVNASKKFFIPVKPPKNPEEKEKLKILYPKYKTTVRALRNYFIEQVNAQEKAEVDETSQVSQKLELEKILEINEIWNQETALMREARMKEEDALRKERDLAIVLEMESKQQERQELARRMVLEDQEESQRFISEENLEQELEKALDARANYNFAIDLEGNQYFETESGQLKAPDTENETSEKVAV